VADQTISVKITAEGEELKREIDSSISALNRLQAATLASNKAGVAATRESIAEQRLYMESVNASSDSFNRLDQLQQRFESRVQSGATRSATSLNSMARGFSVLESSAHASVRSIDAISNATAQLAFGFGPQGMLIGAAVMVGIAMVRAFESAAKAAEKVREKMQEEFVKLGESLNAEQAHQDFERTQGEFEAMTRKVESLKKSIARDVNYGVVGQAFASVQMLQLNAAVASAAELNTESNKLYSLWQDFSKLKPMSELKKEMKETETALAKQKKLLDEYVAKYGGDATENQFLKKNEKLKPFSPGADITKDVMAIKPPTIDVREFQLMRDEWGQYAKSIDAVTASHKLLAGVAGATFGGMAAAMANLGGGVKAMKKALLEPIYTWLKATAISEFIAGMKALFSMNPVEKATAAGHFTTAAEAGAGAAIVGALGGIGGGGGGGKGGGGGGGGGGSGSSSATSLGAGSSTSNGPIKMEITFVQKAPDGREVARLRQAIQRQTDLAQPIRVTM
jgi:ribosomal protein L29